MRNFQGIIFTWFRIYRNIFKSALVYLQDRNLQQQEIIICGWNKKPNQLPTKSINTLANDDAKPFQFIISINMEHVNWTICFICSSFYCFLLAHWCTFMINIDESFSHMFLRDINSVLERYDSCHLPIANMFWSDFYKAPECRKILNCDH